MTAGYVRTEVKKKKKGYEFGGENRCRGDAPSVISQSQQKYYSADIDVSFHLFAYTSLYV